jgi:hypothetical protein
VYYRCITEEPWVYFGKISITFNKKPDEAGHGGSCL